MNETDNDMFGEGVLLNWQSSENAVWTENVQRRVLAWRGARENDALKEFGESRFRSTALAKKKYITFQCP